MKVKALRNYLDKELNKKVSIGDIIEMSKERAEYLSKYNYIKIINEEPEEPKTKKEKKRNED